MARHHTKPERAAAVRAWRASGLTAREYCRKHGLTTSSLQRWARESPAEPAPLQFVRREVERPRREFVVKAGGARITVTRGFDADLLRDVVHALAGARA